MSHETFVWDSAALIVTVNLALFWPWLRARDRFKAARLGTLGFNLNTFIHMDFNQLTNEHLLGIINNPDNDWQGTDNGDTTAKYQARQSFVLAASLILIGRELQSETPILTNEQKEALHDKCRPMLMRPESILGESGNSRFCAEKLLYFWKTKFTNKLAP